MSILYVSLQSVHNSRNMYATLYALHKRTIAQNLPMGAFIETRHHKPSLPRSVRREGGPLCCKFVE